MMGTTYICQHCGRPIGGIPTLLSGNAYHWECTQSPYANKNYQPYQPIPMDNFMDDIPPNANA